MIIVAMAIEAEIESWQEYTKRAREQGRKARNDSEMTCPYTELHD